LIAGEHRALDMSWLPLGERGHFVGLCARIERQRHEKREDQTSKAVERHISGPMIFRAKLVVSAIGW
jgi:hypothetical protein